MNSYLHPPLTPRNGRILEVLGIARISTLKQDERSLGDQEAMLRRWLTIHYGQPFNLRMIAGQGSGERLDRKESAEAQEAVESGLYDLVMSEDLGRIYRRFHALLFCELCEDYKVRLIAVNDNVDTGKGDWRLAALFSTHRHSQSNEDTSQRLKRTMRNRFKEGGVIVTLMAGYEKPDGVKSDDGIKREPAFVPVYDKWFTMLEDGASYADVADWLNREKVPLGKYTRDTAWSGRMVRRITFNPLLKGRRLHNVKTTVLRNNPGRRVSEDAPAKDIEKRDCPHLAFIEPERYDRVIRMLKKRNALYANGRMGKKGKRTVWPGQSITCGVCGHLYYWGGHGQASHMMCSGSRDYVCWNGATFDGTEAARRISAAVLNVIEGLPGFDATLVAKVRVELEAEQVGQQKERAQIEADLLAVQKKIDRATEVIVSTSKPPGSLLTKLGELESQKDGLIDRRDQLARAQRGRINLPPIKEIKRLARDSIALLATNNVEFFRRMRELVPSIVVHPVRLLDGGKVVLRAKVTLLLAPLVGDKAVAEVLAQHTELCRHELTVDLFDVPQRASLREQVVAARANGRTEQQIASELGVTVTATQRAAALQRLMDVRGVTDAYEIVKKPPPDCRKMCRHRHKRYRFKPLPGFPCW